MEFLVTVRPSEGATPTVALAVEREFTTSFDTTTVVNSSMADAHCERDEDDPPRTLVD